MSDAGEIIGRLKLDASDWMAKLEEARGEADSLRAVDPKISVTADTAGAIAGLSAVSASADKVAVAQERLRVATQASDRATASAMLAQMRLADVQSKRGRTAYQVAAAEEALRVATERSDNAALKAIAAEDALAAARNRDTDATVKEAAAATVAADAGKKQAGAQNLLVSGLVALAAAAPPVAAGAVAITGAMTGMGVAGVLAVSGIARELKDGKGPLLEYRDTVALLKSDLYSLQDTAGTGLFAGVQQSVGILNARMPELNSEVHGFAQQLGGIAPTGLDAVLTMFTRANPLFREAGDYLGSLVVQLDQFAHSQGFGNFLQYAEQNLPQVERLLGDVLGLSGDLLKAWGPLGTVALESLTVIIEDVDGLVKAFPGLTGAVLAGAAAWNAWRVVNPLLTGIGTALDQVTAKAIGAKVAESTIGGIGTAAQGAESGVGVLTGRMGGLAGKAGAAGAASGVLDGALAGLVSPLALVAAGAVLVGAAYQESTARGRQLAQTSTDLAGKLAAAHTTNTSVLRDTIAQQLASKNLSAQYKLVGLSSQTVVDAALGQKDAIAKVNGAMHAYIGAGNGVQQTNRSFNINGLRTSFQDLSGAVHNAVLQQQRLQAATRAATVAMYGERAAQLADSAAAEQGVKDADASTSAYHAWAAQIDAAKKAHDRNATAIIGDSDAAIANRTAIEGQVDAMKKHVAQLEKDGAGTQAITAYTDGFIGKLERNAHQLGLNSSQVAAFISKITGIPKSHVTDILIRDEASARIAKIRGELYSLQNRDLTIAEHFVTTGQNFASGGARYGLAGGGTAGDMMAGIRHAATGVTAGYSGTVSGAGTAWSDQAGLYALANGEEVISNIRGQATAFRGVLKAINSQKVRTPAQLGQALGAGQGPTTVITRTIRPEIHIHNPVAVDPVTQTAEAAQYALAYAGLA